ncbi:MAG: hypothetical protein ACM37W_14805 [Actinomycetota bacterium]
MILNIGSDMISSGLASLNDGNLPLLVGDFLRKGMVLAQNLDNVDILRDTQRTWSHFVKSGQIWALLIGIPVGWWLKSILKP